MIDISESVAEFEKAIRGEEVRAGLLGILNALNAAMDPPDRVTRIKCQDYLYNCYIPGYTTDLYPTDFDPNSILPVAGGKIYARFGDIQRFIDTHAHLNIDPS